MAKISEVEIPFLTFDDRPDDPATPDAGLAFVYLKDGVWHSKDDAGVVTEYGTGGGGGSSLQDVPMQSATERFWGLPGVTLTGGAADVGISASFTYYMPIEVRTSLTLDEVAVHVHTAGSGGTVGRIALIDANNDWQPTDLVQDFGTVTVATTGVKTITAIGLAVPAGRYLFGFRHSSGGSVRFHQYRGAPPGLGVDPDIGATALPTNMFVGESYGTFGATPTNWTGVSTASNGFGYFVYGRWS